MGCFLEISGDEGMPVTESASGDFMKFPGLLPPDSQQRPGHVVGPIATLRAGVSDYIPQCEQVFVLTTEEERVGDQGKRPVADEA
jgi:hypothetical protein